MDSTTIVAKAIGIVVEAIEADKDHVHLLFAFPPRLALSVIAQRIKGASSRFIRQQRFAEVLKKLWGRSLWSPSYFVVSCGGAPLHAVKTYVDEQNSAEHQRRARFKRARKAASAKIQMHKTTGEKKTPEKRKDQPALDPHTEVRGFELGSG